MIRSYLGEEMCLAQSFHFSGFYLKTNYQAIKAEPVQNPRKDDGVNNLGTAGVNNLGTAGAAHQQTRWETNACHIRVGFQTSELYFLIITHGN